jgi:hypothetical protein
VTQLKRSYTKKTLKIIFALSGNKCAYPGCTNPIIMPSTDKSAPLVLSQICHIYALSEDGPRGKAGLTQAELNAPENLILFCPTHHVIVDGQHETYPAELLKQWKEEHEANVHKQPYADLGRVQSDVFSHQQFPIELVDQKIEDEVDIIRKSRFFVEFDRVRTSLTLGERLVGGDLSGGTDGVRSRALGWCARFLARTEVLDKAEGYLKLAKLIGTCPENETLCANISETLPTQ